MNKKKVLVIYQDWNDWFLKDYGKFEHWFKEKDKAYDENNEYYIISLGNFNRVIHPENNVTVELFKSSPINQIFDIMRFKKRLNIVINNFKPNYIYSPFIYLLSIVPKSQNYGIIGFLRDITAEMVKSKGGIKKFAGNLFYMLDYLAFKKIDILLYNSPYLEKYALKLGYKGEMIFSPRDIVDKEFFETVNSKEILEKYDLFDKKIILTVARYTKEKNIEMGIKAFKYLPDEYKYLIIGEGPEKRNLEKLAKKLEVENKVIFVGFVEHKNLWKYYKAADVFWLLSKSNFEGIPNVIMEAWHSKLPVIVSKINALSSIVENGKTGVVLKSWNERELAEETLKLLNDKKLYKKLQIEGWKKVNEITKQHVDVKKLFD
jgi:glycosyltransferase involved in cell wall biosynthesis